MILYYSYIGSESPSLYRGLIVLICITGYEIILAGVEKFWRYHLLHESELPFFLLIPRFSYFFRFDNDTHIPFHHSMFSNYKATIKCGGFASRDDGTYTRARPRSSGAVIVPRYKQRARSCIFARMSAPSPPDEF